MLAVMSLLLLLGTAIVSQASVQQSLADQGSRGASAMAIAEETASVLNALVLAGNGTSATLRLPDALPDDTPYSVAARSHLLELRWEDVVVQAPLLAGAVTGELVPGAMFSASYGEGVLRFA